MALFTKSILAEREPTDGVRISVMSRHTTDDGVTDDPRISRSSYDEHSKVLAPKPRLIGDFKKRRLFPWEIFEIKYLEQIRQYGSISVVQALAIRALREDITLLCIEQTPEECHRRLLAQECLLYKPELLVNCR